MSRLYDHSVRTSGPRDRLNDAVIEACSLEELLRVWRYAPSKNFVEGDPTTLLVLDKLHRLRKQAGERTWTRISKQIGF